MPVLTNVTAKLLQSISIHANTTSNTIHLRRYILGAEENTKTVVGRFALCG
jgi:hypothetical protein